MHKRVVVIPAAGFGTRLNMPLDRSKELLLDAQGTRLIDWHISLARAVGAEPVVVTRPEKTDLIQHLLREDIVPLEITPEGEWPNTVLAAEHLWGENTILALPDTRYEPATTMEGMFRSLEARNTLVAATHTVEEPEKWGIVEWCAREITVTEKPQGLPSGQHQAWGLLGWRGATGHELFATLCTRNQTFRQAGAFHLYSLSSFVDLTRDVEATTLRFV